MKKKRFGLLSYVALAIVLGVTLGLFVPAPFVRGVNTIVALIGEFIKFLVPLIIVGLVAPAIAETGRGAGKLLLVTMGTLCPPRQPGQDRQERPHGHRAVVKRG